jgi:hypothetical protein
MNDAEDYCTCYPPFATGERIYDKIRNELAKVDIDGGRIYHGNLKGCGKLFNPKTLNPSTQAIVYRVLCGWSYSDAPNVHTEEFLEWLPEQ